MPSACNRRPTASAPSSVSPATKREARRRAAAEVSSQFRNQVSRDRNRKTGRTTNRLTPREDRQRARDSVLESRFGNAGRARLETWGIALSPMFRERHCPLQASRVGDRKSTRLNSSHLGISYAVFC